ncbi:MAG: dihydrodipicolinate synthase family protein [Acidimicrobiales bacterium]
MTPRAPTVFCCTITPFDAQQRLDEEGLKFLVERLARGGVGAFVGTSSPGEGFALTLAETERLYGVTKEAMAGRQQVRVMGVEPRSADETYELIKIAESVGMDAMQLYCLDLGHGSQPMPAELELFFRTNLERMNIPAVLSTHFMLGYTIPLDMLARLIDDYPHIIGINCTTRDLDYLKQVLELANGRVDVHVGGPQQALTALELGGQGFLCTEAILAPKLCGSVIRHHVDHDDTQTAAAHDRVMRLSAINVWPRGSIRFTKSALRVLGLPGWHLRPPYLPLDDVALEHIARGLDELQIAKTEGLEPTSSADPVGGAQASWSKNREGPT